MPRKYPEGGQMVRSSTTFKRINPSTAIELRSAFDSDCDGRVKDIERRLQCKFKCMLNGCDGTLKSKVTPSEFWNLASAELAFKFFPQWTKFCIRGLVTVSTEYAFLSQFIKLQYHPLITNFQVRESDKLVRFWGPAVLRALRHDYSHDSSD